MKIVVTGGAGYLGSVMVPQLLMKGYDVAVVDNFMYGQASLLDCCHYRNLTITRGDARDTALMKRELKNADYIFPLACLTGAPLCRLRPKEARDVNFDAVKMILKIRSKQQRIIFPTTNSGYGIGREGVYCDENTPLNPVSLYGRLKVGIEKLILEAGNCITLRLATVFGVSPRMRLDLLVNDFTYRAVMDRSIVIFESHFKRNYVHIRDITRVFVHCTEHFDKMKNQTYNVGLSDANLSKLELCLEIKKQVPDFHIIESETGSDPDKRNYIVSNKKLETTGFKPVNSLSMGIRELITGYQVIRKGGFSNV